MTQANSAQAAGCAAEAKSDGRLMGHGDSSSWVGAAAEEAGLQGCRSHQNHRRCRHFGGGVQSLGDYIAGLSRRAAALRGWGHAGPGLGCRHRGSCQGRCRGTESAPGCTRYGCPMLSSSCCQLQDVVIPVDDKGKTTTLTKALHVLGLFSVQALMPLIPAGCFRSSSSEASVCSTQPAPPATSEVVPAPTSNMARFGSVSEDDKRLNPEPETLSPKPEALNPKSKP